MIQFASGGSDPQMSSNYPGINYCDRYESDLRCLQPEELPMLLKIPKLEWPGIFCGYCMLGLGDIVIPGLLLSFVLRCDYIKNLKSYDRNGYFLYLCVSYSIGLGLANFMAFYFKQGINLLFKTYTTSYYF